jgi:putative ABC transport system permease protein
LFSEGDSSTTPPVTIISEALARSYFPNENPLGKRLVFGFPPGPPIAREIIGVVADIHETQLGQKPGPMMYVPFAQAPFWGGELVVKSTLPAAAIVASVRQVVRGIDKNLPVTDIASMPDVIQASTSQPRFRTWLLGLFGVVALLLAAAGVFGVVSYSVASRRREFGVRAALGASPGLIGRMVLGEGLSLTAAGLLAGLIASFALVRFLRSELYGVGAYDPLTFLVSAAVLLSVALLACFIPAWRAMRADPMITLRCE